ncbi:subtilisin-like serine-protease S isoform X2 [Salvia splendens]|uniref:subtilisin-like serine-protease S isoform X2 n=1 Tax=Salvia splendens TaxID=180675 RepID=UPI001C264DDF|nr:subtilisin-like serine-protease S isoform X2 [Salvia splendens]
MQHYVVYMGEHSFEDSESVITANHEMLTSVMGSHEGAQGAVVHHYTKTFRGFSAMLTSDQARKLQESDSVVSVFESKTSRIHTTHSWEFLGVTNLENSHQSLKDSTSDTIIGVIDSGTCSPLECLFIC